MVRKYFKLTVTSDMPTFLDNIWESPGYRINLPISSTGSWISQIKTTFDINYILYIQLSFWHNIFPKTTKFQFTWLFMLWFLSAFPCIICYRHFQKLQETSRFCGKMTFCSGFGGWLRGWLSHFGGRGGLIIKS